MPDDARGRPSSAPRIAALLIGVGLTIATISGLVPGLTDSEGKTFGLFKLNTYQNLLHACSAAWAFVAAYLTRHAAISFLRIFGVLYLADGVMGVLVGSGYLDLAIIRYGVTDAPLWLKAASSAPHLVLGALGTLAGFTARAES